VRGFVQHMYLQDTMYISLQGELAQTAAVSVSVMAARPLKRQEYKNNLVSSRLNRNYGVLLGITCSCCVAYTSPRFLASYSPSQGSG
jgi:hypothetical protein